MALRNRKIKINIVGAGKVGATLALMLHKQGHEIASVVSQTRKSAQRCARLVHCKRYGTNFSLLHQEADFFLIATPDDAIEEVTKKIAHHITQPSFNSYAAHTSGLQTSESLQALADLGARTFSLHPIQSFPANVTPTKQVSMMKHVTFGFEGEAGTKRFALWLVRQLDGRMLVIPKETKNLYHIACVFASNYLLATLAVTEKLGTHFSKRPLDPFQGLINQSIENLTRGSIQEVLTGPIVRGDVGTIKTHISALTKHHPEMLPIYTQLGLQVLEIVREKNVLPDTKEALLKKILMGSE